MKTDPERKFIEDNSISKEAFLAQFEDEPMEIIVQFRDAWKKGNKPFPKFGKESLASIPYYVPWRNDPEGPLGKYGKVYWFCKKSIFGYPYKPEFQTDKINLYRLRVRPGRFSDRPGTRYFFLEEILEENIYLMKDDAVYQNALDRFFENAKEKVIEMTILLSGDIDVSERKYLHPYSINDYMRPFRAVRFADSGKARTIDGQLEIPYDERDFNGNRNLKFKSGTILRITARQRSGSAMQNFYVLDKILETDVQDDELRNLNTQLRTPGKWHVDGIGDFEVKNGEATDLILWDPSDDSTEVNVTLGCDGDNPKAATLAAAHLKRILEDKASFEAKVYGVIAEDLANEDGMIETWEDLGITNGNDAQVILTKEEFMKRLSIVNLSLDSDGSGSVMVDLDEMFTDHAFVVGINADGTFEANGLIG